MVLKAQDDWGEGNSINYDSTIVNESIRNY